MAEWTYFHNLDPFIFSFSENIGIRWYGMAYIAGIFCCQWFMFWLLKKNKTPLNKKDISSFMTYLIFGGLIGGRLGYCIFYQPDLWLKFSSSVPFWGILEIHKGGMASHGGILGLFIASWIFSHKKGYSLFHLLDLIVFGGGVGIIFGRIANFINGELYGRVIEGKSLLGVQFPNEITSWYYYWSEEKLRSLKTVVSKLKSIKNPYRKGEIAPSEALWEAIISGKNRFLEETVSTLNRISSYVEDNNLEVIVALKEVLPVRHPSQIYQAILEGLIPLLIVLWMWRKPIKSGWIAGAWGTSYFLMRIVGELFREPDAHIGIGFLGLTRGQWLSVLGLLVAVIYGYFLHKNRKNLDSY